MKTFSAVFNNTSSEQHSADSNPYKVYLSFRRNLERLRLFKVPPADISIEKIHKEYKTLEDFFMKGNLDVDDIDAETNMKKHKKV